MGALCAPIGIEFESAWYADGDQLSGRHLTVTADLDAVLANIDQVRRDDLHYRRLRSTTR